MKILHLTLHRQWFDAIHSKTKKEEFRAIKPYWQKRLEGREYDIIQFRNGYSPNSPIMQVEYKGLLKKRITYSNGETEDVFAIQLGQILKTKNYKQS